ncbi:MAG: hypothetical protein ACXV3C_14670 [Actinomycetes bacterium]
MSHATALRDTIAHAIYGADSRVEWLATADGTPNAAAYELASRTLNVLPTAQDLAEVAVSTARRHTFVSAGEGTGGCCDDLGSETAECDFRGTQEEHLLHVTNCTTIALAAALIGGPTIRGAETHQHPEAGGSPRTAGPRCAYALGVITALHTALGELEADVQPDLAVAVDSSRVYLEAAHWKLGGVLGRLGATQPDPPNLTRPT